VGHCANLAASRYEHWACNVTPERWQEIKVVLAGALELPPARRPAYLDRACVGDLALRDEVERLLADEQQVQSQFLDDGHFAAAVAAVLPKEKDAWVGRHVGPYWIVELIGAGGMGEVYRAVRDDDQYRKDVALKVIRAGQDSGAVIRRFKTERQILAALDHPGIARLFDGGSTENGLPYLVMELIEGQPITEYCDQHKLSITARLKLFLQVCSAVQHAHQRLVIHRDIKPGNILVTSDGLPKLLDFGIARILDIEPIAASLEATLTTFRILTPRYASPEQVNGEPMTTASDVYSLGVVLFELLTGRSPYPLSCGTAQELAQAANEADVQRPSLAVWNEKSSGSAGCKRASAEELSAKRGISPEKLRKRVSGDLDNIVLMALRKEPARRYASVEQFAADIQRHLANVPVTARRDTLAYRASKFVRRHKAGVLAFSAASLAVLVGLGVAVYEARIARFERARAERRFNDVRKMANSLMFDAHDSIKDLPGTTSARKVLINGALQYLDSLSKEAAGDTTLQRELAAAYDRVGDLLGYNGGANLGDFRGAIQNYEKALAIRESSALANPSDTRINEDLLAEYFHLGFALQDAGDYNAALSYLRKALPLAQRLAAAHPEPQFQDWVAGIYWLTGNVLAQSGNYSQALENYQHSTPIHESIAGDANGNAFFRTHLAGDYVGMGKMLWLTGDLTGAMESVKKAVQILEQLSQAQPANATIREFLGEAYGQAREILRAQGDLTQALEYAWKASSTFGNLVSADPTNSLARANLATVESALGEILVQQGKVRQATPHIRKAIAILEPIERKNHYELSIQGGAYAVLARVYVTLSDRGRSFAEKIANLREARSLYQRSQRLWTESLSSLSSDSGAAEERDRAAREVAKCDATLAELRASERFSKKGNF
jgi:eukaryotic-like serine/threonine-protein kinase